MVTPVLRHQGRQAHRIADFAQAGLAAGSAPRTKIWLLPRISLRDRIRYMRLKIFFTDRTAPAGFVTALSIPEGAVTRPLTLGFNPVRPALSFAGEYPLYARANDIFNL